MKFDKEKLVERIKKDNPIASDEWINNIVKSFEDLDPRLEKNVQEYLNNDEISDIWIDKYCVNSILKIRNNMGGILEAIIDLNVYSKDKEKGETLIWHKYIKR